MFLDVGTLMFNINILEGGTPSWGTDLGQGKGYKFKFDHDEELLTSMVYSIVEDPKNNVGCPLGKGGNRQKDYEYVLASSYNSIYVNNVLIPDASFVLLIVKQVASNSGNHIGRRTLKYSPKITYQGKFINEDCLNKIRKVLNISESAAWFINEINVKNQDELHFKVYVADATKALEFENSKERKAYIKALVEPTIKVNSDVDHAWYVGATGNDENGIYTDFSERYISEGIWLSGWTDKHLDLVKSVKVGDRIALKSISNKKYDLPFDNNGKSVGYMIIKAIGIIVENCGDGRNLKVDWQKVEPVAKEWFGEGLCMGTIHYIEGCGSLIKQALLNFTFENAPQDYDICEQYYSDVKTNGQICENIINDCMRVPRMPRSSIIHPLNIILYGAPGTGKTYSTIDYAVAIIKNKKLEEYENIPRLEIQDEFKSLVNEKKIAFSTFHQSYGYEDFMQGMRPVLNDGVVSFKIVDGVFKSISDRAMADPANNYVIIIDEINRANISKVFGELITLIEDDKRWGELNEISSTLSSGEIFAVPNNLYIIGTMNSADKSISLIDTALRRRFIFSEVVPDSTKIEDEMFKKILEKLNTELVNELDSTDLLIGHSYFMGKSECDLCSIMNNSIIPLLYEYFYDNSKKVKKILSIVLKDYNYDVSKGSFGRFKIFQKVIENDIK